ncbi:hypothetical protein ONZ51_g11093 [Trametes cubensis]|uniref:Uncharacterized protein n=1 Tax=Trametes cubensis TaxID=1111947 RepID=A0AAD7TIT5_9APHY|nr:hypothetical protein ONZ51_g11093 [Trametes cubensis]
MSTLVDYSREIAEHAYNHLKQHVQITFAIGPSQLHDCDTIKTNVDGFISSFDEQANEYALCERALSNLVERARHLEGATGRIISPVLKATYEEVQALRDRLSHATKEITEVGVACLAWFPAEVRSTGAFVFTLSPDVATAAMAPVLADISLNVETTNMCEEAWKRRKQIQKGERKIVKLLEDHNDSKALEKLQQQCFVERLSALAEKINIILGIWPIIKAEMLAMQSSLSQVFAATVAPSSGKLITMRIFYKKVLDILEAYMRGRPLIDCSGTAEEIKRLRDSTPGPARKADETCIHDMRFLDTRTGRFRSVRDPDARRYAILSHTWNRAGEQSYQGIVAIQADADGDSILGDARLTPKVGLDPSQIQERAAMLAKVQGAKRKRQREEDEAEIDVDEEIDDESGEGEGEWMDVDGDEVPKLKRAKTNSGAVIAKDARHPRSIRQLAGLRDEALRNLGRRERNMQTLAGESDRAGEPSSSIMAPPTFCVYDWHLRRDISASCRHHVL